MVVLGSGSSGNCTLVEGARGRLLIDCGLSAREAGRRLQLLGFEPRSVDALLVSHEHADHVGGARQFSRRFNVPIHTTAATARAAGLTASDIFGLVEFEPGAEFGIGDLAVRPFSVPHDAVDNVGVIVECDGARMGYATDLGHASTLAVTRLKECDVLVTEANHDVEMLKNGPYPWSVKQRILGRHGHLSNAEMAALISQSAARRTRHIFLAHMSATNNRPELAVQACRAALDAAGAHGARVHVTSQSQPSEVAEA